MRLFSGLCPKSLTIRFVSQWRMGLLALMAILLLTYLGFWQLQRADEKIQMLAVHSAFEKQDPVLWKPNLNLPVQYQLIKIQGQFLPYILLLDNQHYQHQFGYHVFSPLLMANGKIILVDRGWIANKGSRQSIPHVDRLTMSTSIVGSVYFPSEKNWLLGPVIERERKDLAVVELIDTQLISQLLHKTVYPFIIRLGQQETGGYVREWPTVAMSPQRHYGYALQWFAMAFVVLIIFIALTMKGTLDKRHEKRLMSLSK